MDNLLNHPLLQDLTLERAIDYAVKFIQIMGIPNEFEEKIQVITINDYRGKLPCDFYEMIQVRTHKENDYYPRVFRYSTDNFHYSSSKNPKDISNTWDLTYKIQNSIIYTSIKEGDIEIAYRAMRVDNEGYPLIPDDSSFIQALELYIKKKVFTILFDQGKINQAVLQNTQQEYAWAVGQARSSLSIPTIDQMESISNSWNTLVQRSTEHRRGFKTLGTKEYWRQH